MKPYVFIFDIDGCILGNVRYLAGEFNLYKKLSEILGQSPNYKPNFELDLKAGILRPGFIEFINCIKKRFYPCELYIYTNSSYSWTNNGLVSSIEKASKIKFNKPYFTRETSINYNKSLAEAFTTIFEKLSKKYKNLDKDDIINNRLVFIDNKKENTSTYKNRQITCPDYNYIVYRNIFENMFDIYGNKLYLKQVEELFEYHNHYNPNSKNIKNSNIILYNLKNLIDIRHCELTQNKFKDDNFFYMLCDKLTDLSDKNIALCNK